jgi:hypothetical protein
MKISPELDYAQMVYLNIKKDEFLIGIILV